MLQHVPPPVRFAESSAIIVPGSLVELIRWKTRPR
jgi:hypothetical protein